VSFEGDQGSNDVAAEAADVTMDPMRGQSFLVMLEIMDCLVNRTRPTPLRMLSPYSAQSQEASPAKATPVSIDPHLGLCIPLLRHYHRLCEISNLLLGTSNLITTSNLHDQLTTIHRDAESWRPPDLNDLIHSGGQRSQPDLGTAQVIHLLAQAKLYRLGILLMAHRLRYPFGDEYHDSLAAAWSSEILGELDTAYIVTGGQRVRFVTMPFIIAAVEITKGHHPGTMPGGVETARHRALRALDEKVDKYAPALKAAVRQFLEKIWAERDTTPVRFNWFDSVHKPCPVLDSIQQDLGIPVTA